jgi:hypothetical protein
MALTNGTWRHKEAGLGMQPIADVSTTQLHQFGTIVEAVDVGATAYGSGKFMYVKGVTSGAIRAWVTYNADAGTTTLLTGNAIGPVGVMMSALDAATDFGWIQIYGKAIAKASDVADDAKVYIDTLAGRCDDAAVAGDKVHNAKWASADDTADVAAEVEIAYPFCTDEST